MKAKDKVTLEALRAAKAAFLLALTREGASDVLDDVEEIGIIQKLVKQRQESAVIYKQQGRMDLCDKELEEAQVLTQFLPVQMSEEAIREYLQGVISQVGAAGMRDMGKVMAVASKELAGKADGKVVATFVKELLSE